MLFFQAHPFTGPAAGRAQPPQLNSLRADLLIFSYTGDRPDARGSRRGFYLMYEKPYAPFTMLLRLVHPPFTPCLEFFRPQPSASSPPRFPSPPWRKGQARTRNITKKKKKWRKTLSFPMKNCKFVAINYHSHETLPYEPQKIPTTLGSPHGGNVPGLARICRADSPPGQAQRKNRHHQRHSHPPHGFRQDAPPHV